METTFLVSAVIGATEFLKRLHVRDYFAALVIAVATLVGALCGIFHAPGVPSIWVGIVEGLAASGFVTLATRVG